MPPILHPPVVFLARPGHGGSDQQPPRGSCSHSGETLPGPCSLRAGVAFTLELIGHHLFGLLCPLGKQGEQGCPGGSVEPPQCLWSRPRGWSEVRGRPSRQQVRRFHGNAPQPCTLRAQCTPGPDGEPERAGFAWAAGLGGPPAPTRPGWPAALAGRVPVGGRESRPGRIEGGPSTPHAPVWVPLSLPWDPPRPPRPL